MNTNPDFCHNNDFNIASFVKTPYNLIFGEEYANLSAQAKFLLIIMLARFELSVKNGWTDSDGNTYIILSHKEAENLLSCSETKIKKLYSELINADIIKTKKQGLGKPNLIYVNAHLFSESSQKSSQESPGTPFMTVSEKPSAQSFENPADSFEETSKYNNNKYIKNNYINHINLSDEQTVEEMIEYRKGCVELVKDLICYKYLVENNYNSRILNCIVDALVNMLCSNSPMIRIGNRDIPYNEVKNRIYRIDIQVVEKLYENLAGIRNTINNPTAYLYSAIYNSLDSACMGFPG